MCGRDLHLYRNQIIFISKYNPMPNTYTQIHIQFVFAVKYQKALIDASWKELLHQYITGMI